MLFVERSNRTERLLEGLAERLAAPVPDPLQPSVVVVQGPGMERWLAQSIARRYGVCANTEFIFPRQLLDRLFDAVEGADPEARDSGWDPGRLGWSVARLLVEGRGDADFEPLARHLDAPDGDWRLVQLAGQIAVVLDRYVTFRPDWVRDWSRAKALPSDRNERWQARLVRDLTERLGPGHLADRARGFLEQAQDPARVRSRLSGVLPDPVEIFAVSTLPPLYLSVLDGLARARDVHVSILSPTEGYWADLWREVRDGDLLAAPEGEQAGTTSLFEAAPASPSARLLAGLGRLGGDFQRCLEDATSGETTELDDYASPTEGQESPSLLARLQADLLELDVSLGAEGADAGAPDPSRIVSADDDSIQVHLCHGPRRELEVVEGVLREAFERDPSLTPEDVIVMAPGIDAIAADIEAVFGVPHDEGERIPFRIADRGALKRSPVAETFRALLDLLGGRAARSEVFDWLSHEPARERFGLDEEAVEGLSEWAERSGIRFGLDEEHRESLGLVADRRHTWAGGIERLTLAHAVGASAEVFEGTAAMPLGAFADSAVLGAVGELESMLRRARGAIRTPRGVDDWGRWFLDLLAHSCFQSDSNAHEHSSIRSQIDELVSGAEAAGFDGPIPFDAIRERICDALGSTPAPQAFLAGGVTFCELVPLRAIPFKVIAIMGMSDDAFPRGRPALGFDLMARSPRAGDRSTRNDDRYLFLEALLSARERLILTVPGCDVRDGSDLPPSIVVSELLDAIEASYRLDGVVVGEGSGGLRDWLVVEHPLHGFSPRYFESPGDPRLIGRDAEAFAGAQAQRAAILAGGGETRRFLGAALSGSIPQVSDAEAPPALSLDELVERVLRSTRYFARHRLHLRLPRVAERVDDLDPHELGPLERYALGAALLDDLAAGSAPQEAAERLRSRVSVPVGTPGALAIRKLEDEVGEIARIARARRSGVRFEDVLVEVSLEVPGLGACVVEGRVDQCWPEGRIQLGFGRIDSRGEFEVWIRHLFLCAAIEDGLDRPAKSLLIGRAKKDKETDHVVVFEDVKEARVQLGQLFEWAWAVDQAPLPFFPKASREFARLAGEGKTDQAWHTAHQTYHGGEGNFQFPEFEEELEHARIWEGLSPLESETGGSLRYRFDELAETFFAPLFAARKVEVE